MSFRLIEAEKAQDSVSLLCSVLGVTRAGFYAWRRRPPCARELQDRQLLELIGRIHRQSKETYGVPRIHAELVEDHGVRIARKRVARLMGQLGIEGVSRRGKRPRTTTPAAAAPAAEDLVRRQFKAPRTSVVPDDLSVEAEMLLNALPPMTTSTRWPTSESGSTRRRGARAGRL
jgi:putative transposase